MVEVIEQGVVTFDFVRGFQVADAEEVLGADGLGPGGAGQGQQREVSYYGAVNATAKGGDSYLHVRLSGLGHQVVELLDHRLGIADLTRKG
ncbi:MAG: hypothetical protein AAGD35_10285 [Actinomycetota bacterium]